MTEKKNKKKSLGEISRREFLIDAGIVLGSTAAVGTAALASSCGGKTETVTSTVTKDGPSKTVTTTVTDVVEKLVPLSCTEDGQWVIDFKVNGKRFVEIVEPNETLHHLLHEKLGFKSIKTFCSRGGCGSCSVLIDGRPILSCMTFASSVHGKEIWTAEGIATEMPALIDAYVDNECMQCGYCTPGFIVTAAALLKRNSDPTTDEIREALAGNLCRCGTYPVHIPAVKEAAKALKGGR
jgi:aerobic-type carbon monoxide dehydrogenase small subunit (CoxS/CutS family)